MRTVTTEELEKMLATGRHTIIVDVREPAEFGAGHIQSAVNLPAGDDFVQRFEENFPNKNTSYIFYSKDSASPHARDCAAQLDARDYQNPYVYEPGKEGWVQSGHSLVS